MYYDLTEIKVLDGFRIQVCCEDQTRGVVDLTEIVNRGGVFERLRDRDFFEQARIDPEWAVLCWPDGIDIAPESLYASIKQCQKTG